MRPDPGPAALPPGAARLFPHHDGAGLDHERAAPFLIARLLEDGDGADLAWLAARAGEAGLADWLARRGGRQLSARSRAFWRLVLGRPGRPAETAPPGAAAADLWPL